MGAVRSRIFAISFSIGVVLILSGILDAGFYESTSANDTDYPSRPASRRLLFTSDGDGDSGIETSLMKSVVEYADEVEASSRISANKVENSSMKSKVEYADKDSSNKPGKLLMKSVVEYANKIEDSVHNSANKTGKSLTKDVTSDPESPDFYAWKFHLNVIRFKNKSFSGVEDSDSELPDSKKDNYLGISVSVEGNGPHEEVNSAWNSVGDLLEKLFGKRADELDESNHKVLVDVQQLQNGSISESSGEVEPESQKPLRLLNESFVEYSDVEGKGSRRKKPRFLFGIFGNQPSTAPGNGVIRDEVVTDIIGVASPVDKNNTGSVITEANREPTTVASTDLPKEVTEKSTVQEMESSTFPPTVNKTVTTLSSITESSTGLSFTESSVDLNFTESITDLNLTVTRTELNVTKSSTELNLTVTSTELNVTESSTELNLPESSTSWNFTETNTALNFTESNWSSTELSLENSSSELNFTEKSTELKTEADFFVNRTFSTEITTALTTTDFMADVSQTLNSTVLNEDFEEFCLNLLGKKRRSVKHSDPITDIEGSGRLGELGSSISLKNAETTTTVEEIENVVVEECKEFLKNKEIGAQMSETTTPVILQSSTSSAKVISTFSSTSNRASDETTTFKPPLESEVVIDSPELLISQAGSGGQRNGTRKGRLWNIFKSRGSTAKEDVIVPTEVPSDLQGTQTKSLEEEVSEAGSGEKVNQERLIWFLSQGSGERSVSTAESSNEPQDQRLIPIVSFDGSEEREIPESEVIEGTNSKDDVGATKEKKDERFFINMLELGSGFRELPEDTEFSKTSTSRDSELDYETTVTAKVSLPQKHDVTRTNPNNLITKYTINKDEAYEGEFINFGPVKTNGIRIESNVIKISSDSSSTKSSVETRSNSVSDLSIEAVAEEVSSISPVHDVNTRDPRVFDTLFFNGSGLNGTFGSTDQINLLPETAVNVPNIPPVNARKGKRLPDPDPEELMSNGVPASIPESRELSENIEDPDHTTLRNLNKEQIDGFRGFPTTTEVNARTSPINARRGKKLPDTDPEVPMPSAESSTVSNSREPPKQDHLEHISTYTSTHGAASKNTFGTSTDPELGKTSSTLSTNDKALTDPMDRFKTTRFRPCNSASECDVRLNEGCISKGDISFCGCRRSFVRHSVTGRCVASITVRTSMKLPSESFHRDLKNPHSDLYQKKKNEAVVTMWHLLHEEPRLLSAVSEFDVSGFDAGSLVVHWNLKLAATSSGTVSNLVHDVDEDLRDIVDGHLPKSAPLKLQNAELLSVSDAVDPCEDSDLNYCSKDADCLRDADHGFRCKCKEDFKDNSRNRTAYPGEVCVALCPKAFCSNQGHCELASDGENYCICKGWYFGTNCEFSGIVAIASFSGANLLIILIITGIVMCIRRRRRRRHHSYGAESGKHKSFQEIVRNSIRLADTVAMDEFGPTPSPCKLAASTPVGLGQPAIKVTSPSVLGSSFSGYDSTFDRTPNRKS